MQTTLTRHVLNDLAVDLMDELGLAESIHTWAMLLQIVETDAEFADLVQKHFDLSYDNAIKVWDLFIQTNDPSAALDLFEDLMGESDG